ncbi:MAG: DUF3012 domain-containing protein [Magnetococcales bacterium]|nr:DUF3012 domain-containing protein [Magnetococcales bacterium]
MTEQKLKQICTNLLTEEEGSPEWCAQLKAKPKVAWSPNDAALYTRSCLFSE